MAKHYYYSIKYYVNFSLKKTSYEENTPQDILRCAVGMKVLHPLLDFHKSLAGIGKCQWVQFFSHGGIDTLLFHPYLHIRCHFSGCPSAATCNMATKIY